MRQRDQRVELGVIIAKAAIRQGNYRFGLYPELAGPASCAGLAHDLFTFVQECAPPSGEFSAQSFPPCAMTIVRETDSPMPMPEGLVEKKGSKIRAITAGSMPAPESRTVSSMLPLPSVLACRRTWRRPGRSPRLR